MSEPLHWVMASSEARRLDDGDGGTVDLVVYTESDADRRWRWSAERGSGYRVAGGHGYPDPISARAAAEYWLSVTREQSALRAALEAEAQS